MILAGAMPDAGDHALGGFARSVGAGSISDAPGSSFKSLLSRASVATPRTNSPMCVETGRVAETEARAFCEVALFRSLPLDGGETAMSPRIDAPQNQSDPASLVANVPEFGANELTIASRTGEGSACLVNPELSAIPSLSQLSTKPDVTSRQVVATAPLIPAHGRSTQTNAKASLAEPGDLVAWRTNPPRLSYREIVPAKAMNVAVLASGEAVDVGLRVTGLTDAEASDFVRRTRDELVSAGLPQRQIRINGRLMTAAGMD